MKIVIDMPDDAYKTLLVEQRLPSQLDIEYFIMHGTPLTKIENSVIARVLEIIDTSQTYKMFAGEEDTYIDKRVIREAVEALREDRA